MVAFFRLSPQARAEFQSGDLSPQARQWRRLLRAGKSVRKDVTFKAIGQMSEESLAELPAWLHGYNGKPVLVTESASFVGSLLPEVLEIDVDINQWALLARQTLYLKQ